MTWWTAVQSLVRASPHALATAPLILTAASGTQTSPLLLIPSTKRLSAESKILIVDGLTPGVEGLDVWKVVVVAIRRRRLLLLF